MAGLIILLVFFVLMWVLFILPQQRRAKAQQQYVASLKIADEIITAGGIHGTIIELDDDLVRLRIATGVTITIARGAINRSQHDPEAEAASESDALEGIEPAPESALELEELDLDVETDTPAEFGDDSDDRPS